ncbi:MAG: FecR domain-containing protein [Prolixibacteraceae bacterium]
MNDDRTTYELLILKEFEGELSSLERIELDTWLLDRQNRTFYEEQQKLWQSMDDYRRMRKINKREALKKVETKLFVRFPAGGVLRTLERVAAILFIPLLLAGIWFFTARILNGNGDGQLVYNTVEVPLGMRSSMVLPDGTTVSLNAGSRLKYPAVFSEEERVVELTGEAYFDVTKDKQRPFIVSASDIAVRVLGTSFNCSAYPEDERIETALIQGEIEISGRVNGENKIVLKPGELAVFKKRGRTIEKNSTNLDKYVAWKSGKLIFRDDSMATVLEKLGRWYNVEFQVEDDEILGYEYSATFSGESLDRVLKMLALSAPISFNLMPREKLSDTSYEKQIIKLMKK